MIEAIKEIALIMKDVPDSALLVLGGFLFYKLAITGSIVGAITKVILVIAKYTHDFHTKPKIMELDEVPIRESAAPEMAMLIKKIQAHRRSSNCYDLDLNSNDFEWALEAVEDKIFMEKAELEMRERDVST